MSEVKIPFISTVTRSQVSQVIGSCGDTSPTQFEKTIFFLNQKTEMPEVPLISTVSHYSKRKIAYTYCKRSSRKHSLPGESWVNLPAVFFFPTNRPRSRRQFAFNRKLPSNTFLKKFLIPVLRMHLKRRGTHGCLLLITLFYI